MLDTHGRESAKYCIFVSTLLFLVGFIVILLFSVVSVIPIVGDRLMGIGITSATYGGYIIGTSPSFWVLRRYGFKAAFLTSLAVCCVGTLMLWPSGALRSYPGYVICSVVVGMSSAVLDTAANAFLTLCGSPEYAEVRVLFGQGIEAVGGTVSYVLCQKALFVDVTSNTGLINVQWAYVAIAIFTVLLGLFFYYLPLPEATESDFRSRDQSL